MLFPCHLSNFPSSAASMGNLGTVPLQEYPVPYLPNCYGLKNPASTLPPFCSFPPVHLGSAPSPNWSASPRHWYTSQSSLCFTFPWAAQKAPDHHLLPGSLPFHPPALPSLCAHLCNSLLAPHLSPKYACLIIQLDFNLLKSRAGCLWHLPTRCSARTCS